MPFISANTKIFEHTVVHALSHAGLLCWLNFVTISTYKVLGQLPIMHCSRYDNMQEDNWLKFLICYILESLMYAGTSMRTKLQYMLSTLYR